MYPNKYLDLLHAQVAAQRSAHTPTRRRTLSSLGRCSLLSLTQSGQTYRLLAHYTLCVRVDTRKPIVCAMCAAAQSSPLRMHSKTVSEPAARDSSPTRRPKAPRAPTRLDVQACRRVTNVSSCNCSSSYVEAYGQGDFDGAGSGHYFYGTLRMPPSGWVNNCDGKRGHIIVAPVPEWRA